MPGLQPEKSTSKSAPIQPERFGLTLQKHAIELVREKTSTLQINVGLLCNQACRHCHLEAGPSRTEIMSPDTVRQVIEYAGRNHFEIIDITGGAPELNPEIDDMLVKLSRLTPRLILRSNLTALDDANRDKLMALCKELGVVIIASFPSLDEAQVDSQRGQGVFKKSVAALQELNSIGYGQEESRLELNLVSNPTGAFLPTSQDQAERRFRQVLGRKWGIKFNKIFGFANVPLGRYRSWLEHSGNLPAYLNKLADSFNPCAVPGLMCRRLVSVDWQGYLYDCDFNLSKEIHLGDHKTHISEMNGLPQPGSAIATADHCYACTAGSGFT
jgi:radical SAM/Cys-rich protein